MYVCECVYIHVMCRLRQCCCHLQLMTSALKADESDLDNLALEVAMGGLSLGNSDRDDDEVDAPCVSHTVSYTPFSFLRHNYHCNYLRNSF